MAKVAKLVCFSLMVRVIVDEDATDEQIVEASRPKIREVIKDDLHENLESIEDDEQMPYGEAASDLAR